MVTFRTLFQISYFALTYARPTEKIEWGPCNKTEVPDTLPMQCGTLKVPLDYSDPKSDKKLKLELAKLPAVIKPSKGSILINFGGPGGEGRSALASQGSIYQPLTGGEYDLVTFDPRGTGNTLPFTCADTAAEVVALAQQSSLLANASDVELGKLWALGEVMAETCYDQHRETGNLIDTVSVAKDLISVVDALGEDGLLRYWGVSYGTVLGRTVAAMFPDRIDKMLLDGVQNVHEYYHAFADFEEWTVSDELYSGIFSTCLEAPDKCALSHRTKDPKELEQTILDLLEEIKYRPIPIDDFLLDYSALKKLFGENSFSSAGWPGLATTLNQLLDGEYQKALPVLAKSAMTPQVAKLTMATHGIHCVDRTARESDYETFLPTVERLYDISKWSGEVAVGISMACAQWKFDAKERYEGDFKVKTKNPILILGNTYDAHTPLKSAYNASADLEDSVVLEIDGYGHGSSKLPSRCTLLKTTDYWLDGTLPEPKTVCEVDAKPYSNTTWADVFKEFMT